MEVKENLYMAFQIKEPISLMEEEVVKEENVKKCLKEMKTNKDTGPDGRKLEFYKAFLESELLSNTLVCAFQQLLQLAKHPNDS